MEGEGGTFTWNINGPPTIIHSTTIYFGTKSSETMVSYIAPEETKYTDSLKEFIKGDYYIPLRFIANVRTTPGTYFFRAYALINGKHYWTDEGTFVVKPLPKHGIKVIDRPTNIKVGENAAFTWEIDGPSSTTSFTTIVVGKESKTGSLDETTDMTMTPYTIFVKEFTNGVYQVPLRFVGNAPITEVGVYYFRALAFINGKNIWSDEYSFKVE